MITPAVIRQSAKGIGHQGWQNDSFDGFVKKTAEFHFDALENSDIFN